MRGFEKLGVLLAALCMAALPQTGWAAEVPLSLNISTSRTVVTQGDYVEIKITLKNTSDREFNFGVTDEAVIDYALEVFGPDGSPAPRSKVALRNAANPLFGPSHSIWISMFPGREQIENLDMEDSFDLSAPGTYSIQALWPPGSPTLRSNVIVLTVQPEPPSNGPSASEVLASAEAVHPKATLSPCTLKLETDRPVVSSGRGVVVLYTLTNTTNRVVQFERGTTTEYAVEVRDESGVLLPDKAPNAKQKELIAHEEPDQDIGPDLTKLKMALKPGGSATGGLDIARYVDLTRPGIYSIQLWRRLPKQEGGAEVRSNVIVVTIKPAIQ
jgi:hypothetical protein